jgi:hypothetical protein
MQKTKLIDGERPAMANRRRRVKSVPVADSSPAEKSYLEWAILAALAAVMILQIWTSVTQLSITSDEVDHLHAAYRYLQCRDFGWNPEHPPLVKIIAAMPMRAMSIADPIDGACGRPNSKTADFFIGREWVFANPERVLTAARFAVSVLSVLLLLTVWFFARKLFGLPVAIISGILLAFEPNILAHGGLVTTDVAATLGFALAVYALYRYIAKPNYARVLALGLATGFALTTKYSTILLVVILPALLLLDAIFFAQGERGRKLLRYAGALLAVAAIAFVVVWAVYGFRYTARPLGGVIWSPPKLPFAHGRIATQVIPEIQRAHILPEAYLVGLQDVLSESEIGRPSFLLGRSHYEGTSLYFPMEALIKFTLPFLVMVIISAAAITFWRSRRRELLFLLLPPIVFFAFSMTSKLNMGIRHLLPMLPFLTIFAAAGTWSVLRGRRWSMAVLVALLAFQAATSLHAYPNYISYSNELWGGPGETYRYLAESNVDWGQAQKMARAYIEETHPANCIFLQAYVVRNSDYGIPCAEISEVHWDPLTNPYTGTIIVSSTLLDGIGIPVVGPATRRTFQGITPTAKLGGSALMVYEGTFDLSPLVALQLVSQARAAAAKEHNPQLALELAQKAAALDPSLGDAHIVMCASYHQLGQTENARRECNMGVALIRKDPQFGPQTMKFLDNYLAKNGLDIYTQGAPNSSESH